MNRKIEPEITCHSDELDSIRRFLSSSPKEDFLWKSRTRKKSFRNHMEKKAASCGMLQPRFFEGRVAEILLIRKSGHELTQHELYSCCAPPAGQPATCHSIRLEDRRELKLTNENSIINQRGS